ncbi:hypothetical protein EJ110_NYTH06466 [Nymphaea thermarum]|nr:hypothetical protein EJ110_NYTH06466 [Nymphaea thermarum]
MELQSLILVRDVYKHQLCFNHGKVLTNADPRSPAEWEESQLMFGGIRGTLRESFWFKLF